jgi:hypothetical protein
MALTLTLSRRERGPVCLAPDPFILKKLYFLKSLEKLFNSSIERGGMSCPRFFSVYRLLVLEFY